ncbi:hypothetical protein ACW9KT_15475 [Hymenobacter sp. HD11105]
MSPARFADLLQSFFQLDTWYTMAGAERAVKQKRKATQATLTAQGLVAGATRAGWLEHNPTTQEFCLPSFCWVAQTQKRHVA